MHGAAGKNAAPAEQGEKKMKKIILMIFAVILLAAAAGGYYIYRITVDTEYAVKFSEVFDTYDINEIDKYFDEDTLFIYGQRQKTYKELRDNIKTACDKKYYKFYSYGHGNNRFKNNRQTVLVRLSGNIYGVEIGDFVFYMVLKRTGPFSFKIESVDCSEKLLGDLFFGIVNAYKEEEKCQS